MNDINSEAGSERAALLKNTLAVDRVRFLEATTKDAALREMIDILSSSPTIEDKDALTRAVFERETLMSTGIGLGLAVPHVRLPSVRQMTMAIGISREGIADYASLDERPVHLVFLIAAREGHHTEYIRLLAAISSRAKDLDVALLECADAETFCRVFLGTRGDANEIKKAT